MKKKHIGAKLDPALVEAIRNAAWHIGRGWSLNKIVEDGALEELTRLEQHNGGAFPGREGDLTRQPGTPGPRKGKPKATVSWRMYEADQDRLKNAAAALKLSVTSIVEDGARRVLERLQKKHNKGLPFPEREGDLPGATPRDDED